MFWEKRHIHEDTEAEIKKLRTEMDALNAKYFGLCMDMDTLKNKVLKKIKAATPDDDTPTPNTEGGRRIFGGKS